MVRTRIWLIQLPLAIVTLLCNFPLPTLADECDQGNPEYLWDANLKECLKIVDPSSLLTFTCKSNLQCTKSTLGPLSRCSGETKRCECYDIETDGRNPAKVYEGVCYVRRNLGDFCSNDGSCKAGIHPAAVCAHTEDFLPHETVCICPEGQSCKTLGDPCKSDRECQLGLGPGSECVLRVGELQCDCKGGEVCAVEFAGDVRKGSLVLTVVIPIAIILGIIVAIIVIIKVVRWRQSRSNNNFRRVSDDNYF